MFLSRKKTEGIDTGIRGCPAFSSEENIKQSVDQNTMLYSPFAIAGYLLRI